MLIAKGHVGGLAVNQGWLHVGSESAIRGYRLGTVKGALAGANTNTVYPRAYNRASSSRVAYLGTGDRHPWAGPFSETSTTHLNGYVQTSSSAGTLDLRPAVQLSAPPKAQGVTVTDTHAIFSTSYGRTARGNLWSYPRDRPADTDAAAYCFRVPTMNEGITVLDGRVHLLFESGAYTYNRGLLDPDNPTTQIHSAALSDVTSLAVGGPED